MDIPLKDLRVLDGTLKAAKQENQRLRALLGECWMGLDGMGPTYREGFDLDYLFSKLKEFEPKEEIL